MTIPDASLGDVAVINITNTAAAGTGGYGALRAAGQTPIYNRPTANQYSSVNFAAKTPPNPNLAFVTIGTNKQICYDNQVSAAHVILDHAATIPANNINAFDPKRILDTRSSNRIAPNTSRCVTIPDASLGDVAVINITNTAAAGTGGYGALRAAGQTPIYNRPTANQYSSVNFAAQTPPNPNLAFVTIGTNKQICYDNQVSAAHVILDHAATIPANNINAFDPKRILDTRSEQPSLTPPTNGTRALDVLEEIPIQNEQPDGYNRDLFPHWISQGGGCDTRDQVLITESTTTAQVREPCEVVSGNWTSKYDGQQTSSPSNFDIDHVVALKEAWESGALLWQAETRKAFANDLSDKRSLTAVSASSNRSKGARDPADWIPTLDAAVCPYLADWISIKARWDLSMDQYEYDQIKEMLFERCPTQEIEPWTVPNRSPDARSSNRIAPNTSRCVTIPDASLGDVAVINITNTAAAGTGGYGALRAAGQTPIYNRPTANQYSSVNFAAQTPPNPNLAFVTIGTNNKSATTTKSQQHTSSSTTPPPSPPTTSTPLTPNASSTPAHRHQSQSQSQSQIVTRRTPTTAFPPHLLISTAAIFPHLKNPLPSCTNTVTLTALMATKMGALARAE